MTTDDDRLIPCAVDGCEWDDRGTAHGSPPPLCGGYGSWRPECRVHYASTDPEDIGTYADYLAKLGHKT